MSASTQKQLNRASLLAQGVTLLTQKGYHGTGLKEILDTVNIPKGSFYNYFGSKENFAAEAIQFYMAPFIQQLSNHLQTPDTDGLTAIQRYFDELITELEKSEFKGGCLLGNLMGEISDTSEVVSNALHKAVTEYRDLLRIGLERAQQEGSVRRDKSAEELADLLTNAWQGVLLRMKIEKSSVPLKQFYRHFLDDYFKA